MGNGEPGRTRWAFLKEAMNSGTGVENEKDQEEAGGKTADLCRGCLNDLGRSHSTRSSPCSN